MEKQIKKQDRGIQESKQSKFKELVEQCITSKKGKVLVIEDNTSALMGMMAALTGKGMEVVSAVTKEEAIKALAKHKDIELVITDISYPEKEGMEQDPESGLSFIRHVKDKRPELKVIAQSSSNEYLAKAAQAGADEKVNKRDLPSWIKGEEIIEGTAETATAKREKLKEVNVLIVTSHKDYAESLINAIKGLVDNAKVVDWCMHKESSKKFSPDKYTHVIASDDYLSCEDENVKRPKDEAEAKEFERQGFELDRELRASYEMHKLDHMDTKGKVRKILFVECGGEMNEGRIQHDFGVPRFGEYFKDRAYLKQPILLTDLIKLLKE